MVLDKPAPPLSSLEKHNHYLTYDLGQYSTTALMRRHGKRHKSRDVKNHAI
jgi:hypothetical protein